MRLSTVRACLVAAFYLMASTNSAIAGYAGARHAWGQMTVLALLAAATWVGTVWCAVDLTRAMASCAGIEDS